MGNCQAIDNATIEIQHPCGRVDKLYWTVAASEVMKLNPGHYVALLLTTTTKSTTTTTTTSTTTAANNLVRVTRIKLLRPTDNLVFGQVYRLITTKEVMKGLWEKNCTKMKQKQLESADKKEKNGEESISGFETTARRSELDKSKQVTKHERTPKHERTRPRTTPMNSGGAKSRAWQPSLKSITESGS